jgi:hypothetical protein
MENIIEKMNKDIKEGLKVLDSNSARYLVDTYYQIQEYRKATYNQVRKLTKEEELEPDSTLEYFAHNFELLENEIKKALKIYVEQQPIGRWLLSITGIGEVISAGLLANIDISKCETAGAIWRFAGLDPTIEWGKGELRPFNARLKTLCWKIGESFVKVSNNDKDVYGKIYKQRKDYEMAKNEAGDYADQAKAKLEKYKIGKDTDAYKYYSEGKLPPAHIQSRAKRYAVKIFLSHLFDVWYKLDRGQEPPKPYALAILGHAHEIEIPNLDVVGM